jgi:hypothetical protein
MTDDNQVGESALDRRRFIKASAGGAALVWAAPTITGLNARAFAAGSDPDCLDAFSDNFDADGSAHAGDFGSKHYATVTSLINFTISGGNVDIIGEPGQTPPNFNYGFGEDYYIDLSGTNPPPTSGVVLRSKQCFNPGTYTVTIRYAGDQRGDAPNENSFTASLGGTTAGPFTPASTDGILTATFSATVTSGNNHLVITHTDLGADNVGVILLSVNVA